MTLSIREAYGLALAECGREFPEIVVLDADVSASTRTLHFAKAFPERFFNMGICEANMTGAAAGLALTGATVFVNTFAGFVSSLGLLAARSLISYDHLNVKLAGAYGGLSDGLDGPSHHAVDDLAIMRALPGMTVLVASDATMTDRLVRMAAQTPGPMYIRLSREAMPDIYLPNDDFTIGKGKIVWEGSDATIIACGVMVGRALAAAEILQNGGISTRVVDMFTVKPLDCDLIKRCAAETGAIITAEEHTKIGGLGGAVCEFVAQGGLHVPMSVVGLDDAFGTTGPYGDILDAAGLSVEAIVARVRETVGPL